MVQSAGGAEGPPLPKQPRRHLNTGRNLSHYRRRPGTWGTIGTMPEPSAPVTGTQHEISAGDYRATITELGANLRSLLLADTPLIAGYEPDEVPPAGAGELLIPWPNRVDHGRYSFGGQDLQLDLSEPAAGNAIHGLTRWASWQLIAAGDDNAELGLRLLGRPGYPFCLELRAMYRLSPAEGLEVRVQARNVGSRPAPYGTGSHPYLRASAGPVDECALKLPAEHWLAADDRGIPVGEPQAVAGTEFDFREGRLIGPTGLDHAFTGLTRDGAGRAWVGLTGAAATLALWVGEGYRWLQVFTGDALGPDRRRRALAIEPMTCPPNAFVTGTDLLTLDPGASVTHHWGLQAMVP
jgi:aldose 1-epimerase